MPTPASRLEPSKLGTPSNVVASALYGSLVGFLAGLVGLGGAELEIPFILYYLNLSVEDMVVANLMVSLATSSVSFVIRARLGLFSWGSTLVAVVMIAGALPGAYLGAVVSHRISHRRLKGFIAVILGLVVARLLIGIVFGSASGAGLGLYPAVALALSTGFAIGVISGSVGVAGGEYRIPILTYIFGFPIKIAGTASQLVSLPTILSGLWKHRKLGFVTARSKVAALMLGVPSAVGALLSGFLVPSIPSLCIDLLFALIILYTIVRLLGEVARDRTGGPTSNLTR